MTEEEKWEFVTKLDVDLLLGGDGKLELLDFKTSPRPTDSPELLTAYVRHLCTYAHVLDRAFIVQDAQAQRPRDMKPCSKAAV